VRLFGELDSPAAARRGFSRAGSTSASSTATSSLRYRPWFQLSSGTARLRSATERGQCRGWIGGGAARTSPQDRHLTRRWRSPRADAFVLKRARSSSSEMLRYSVLPAIVRLSLRLRTAAHCGPAYRVCPRDFRRVSLSQAHGKRCLCVFSATSVTGEHGAVYSQNRSGSIIQVESDLAEDQAQHDCMGAVAGPQLLQAVAHVVVDRGASHPERRRNP
jgi:hypothetical protein